MASFGRRARREKMSGLSWFEKESGSVCTQVFWRWRLGLGILASVYRCRLWLMRAFDAEWIGMFRESRSCGMGWATSWQRCFERRPALLKGYCRLKGKAPASVICLSPYLAAGLDFCCSCLDNGSTVRPRRCVPSFPGNPDKSDGQKFFHCLPFPSHTQTFSPSKCDPQTSEIQTTISSKTAICQRDTPQRLPSRKTSPATAN